MSYTELILSSGSLVGYLLFFFILFAECGLLIGFFLPGDSLLFPLGILAAQGHFNILLLILIGSMATFLGNWLGYVLGKQFGPGLFNRPDSRFFKKQNLHQAHQFYERYGRKTIFLARFVPVVRTFVPVIAGIAEMPFSVFMIYNLIGGVAWVSLLTLIGYFLGTTIHDINRFSVAIIAGIIILSFLPAIHHLHSNRKKS